MNMGRRGVETDGLRWGEFETGAEGRTWEDLVGWVFVQAG